MKFATRILQLTIILIPVAIFFWLATQWLVPSGVFFVSHTVGEESPFIDEIQPNQRVMAVGKTAQGESVQAIISDPTFFFVHPHRDFKAIELGIWFQNDTLPIVELGGLASNSPESYIFTPLHSRFIDETDWDRTDEGGKVLLQRERKYNSIADFLKNPPERDLVAVYRTEFDVPYRIDGYSPSGSTRTIDASLRGHHEFKTYIKDETLRFTFEYMDMNRDEGEDSVRITVFNEDGLPVAEARGSDDGNISTDAIPTGLKTIELTAGGLSEGVYKVVMNAPQDIFFRKIKTTQQKIVFLRTVFLGDEVGYREPVQGATFYTGAKRLRLQTRHAEGVQTLSTGGTFIDIEEPYEWYTFELPGDGVEAVTSPDGDLQIVTDGNIAFSSSQYFDPDPVNLTYYSDLDAEGIDYVLAQYVSPRQEGDWLVARVAFAADELFAEEDGTWKISFSTPGIDEFGGELLVNKIEAWLYRSLFVWEDLGETFKQSQL